MPRNGSGTMSVSVNFVTEAASPPIETSKLDTALVDIAAEMTNSIARDGQTNPSANLPMNGFRHTGAGAAQALTDYATATDVIDQDLIYYVDSGAADAYVITLATPAISAYEEGQRFVFRATNANTGASTLNVNAIGAVAIQTNDAAALAANMIVVGGYYEVTYDANGSRFVLTSPHSLTSVKETRSVISGGGLTGGGTLAADRTLAVGAGDGITVNADDVQVDSTVIRTTGAQTIGGAKTFSADAVFEGDLTVQDQFFTTGIITDDIGSSTSQADYSPTGLATASIVRVVHTATCAISGLAAGADGQRIIISNADGGGFALNLLVENAGSSAANRFSAGVTVADGESVEFWYDGTSSRWRPISAV